MVPFDPERLARLQQAFEVLDQARSAYRALFESERRENLITKDNFAALVQQQEGTSQAGSEP